MTRGWGGSTGTVRRVPSFQLVHVSGHDLGVHHFDIPTWRVGVEIPLGDRRLRVVAVAWARDDDRFETVGPLVVDAIF